MNKKEINLIFYGHTAGNTVSKRSFYRNNHISQEVGIKIAEISLNL